MFEVKGLVWDDWNKEHIVKHGVSKEEVEEACKDEYQVIESYRKRILLVCKTKSGRTLAVVLSPEDRNSQPYVNGIYYAITAYEKEAEK